MVAVMPELWLDWFTADEAAYKVAALYLAIAGPFYGFFMQVRRCTSQAREPGDCCSDLCWYCTLPDYFLGGSCGGLDGLADSSGFCRSQRWITCDRYRHGSLLIQFRLATSSANQQKLIVKLPYELNSVGEH